jgi:HAMP domain-containing protein
LRERGSIGDVHGFWRESIHDVNSLIEDLVHPTSETARVIGRGRAGRPVAENGARGRGRNDAGRIPAHCDDDQQDGRPARLVRFEVTRVAREVGTEGKLGGQARVRGVAGTWKDLTDSVNFMASNLTSQVRNIAEVTTAVASGDLSKKITVDVKGEILDVKNTVNTMVDQLSSFAGGSDAGGARGRHRGQARRPGRGAGVAGTWKDLTDSVNFMASNLTSQVRNIADVTTAVAAGDLSEEDHGGREGRDPRSEEHREHDGGPALVVRGGSDAGGARGRHRRKLGGQAQVEGVSGTWKDLTDSVNFMASNLTSQVRNIAEVTTAVAKGDLSKKITVDVKGEILEVKEHREHDGGPALVVRGGSDAGGARGRHRRQTRRPGRRARRGRHLEGLDRLGELHGLEPHLAGAEHRRGDDRGGVGRPVEEDHGGREGRESSK